MRIKTVLVDNPSGYLVWMGCLLVLGMFWSVNAKAHHTETHFEDASTYQIVYQCNRADNDYLSHILFSVGELIRKYGDDVEVVVACFGPGLHLLGRTPGRPIAPELQERANSLSAYGVRFHACGNTMESLGWEKKDLMEYVKVVPIGVEDIMLLQKQGFAYMAW